ncbi:hypothetical protein HIM_09044 [Hirsutella minnesotensis 3608]|uniref:Uncharacterized protein n=1 Tax=Hirsutella minnesotensis 3608 TaxID=1043627 RepID=A0A0F7ZLY8_9HYPO|nr:hypothetical protein HIM_09044 [Hirsutella minnesotensis 3608]
MDHQITPLSPTGITTRQSLQIFSNYLVNVWERTKTPYGLDEALESVRKPNVTQQETEETRRQDTAAIFLDCGFQAWLAYYLATHLQARHYKGRRFVVETITAFDLLSLEDRTQVAEAVAAIECHATVKNAIRKLMASPKRRRKSLEHLHTRFDNVSSDVKGLCGEARLPTLATESVIASLGSVVEEPSYTINAIDSTTTVHADSPGSPTETQPPPAQEQTCTYASYHGIMAIFPPYICSALNSKDGKADVTMGFPHVRHYGLKPYCLMSLVIKASEIPYIVMRLFKVHIGTGEGIRHFVLENGGRLLPVSGFQFQGALDGDIVGLLGSKISKAIAESPVREGELAEGIVATRCVSMSFGRSPQDNGVLNLSLGLTDGIWMKNALFTGDSS